MGNEVKEQGFTDRLLCPTGLWWDAATHFLFQLLLFFRLVVSAGIPAARALKRVQSSGGVSQRRRDLAAPRGGGGGGGSGGGSGLRLRLDVDGVVVVCLLLGGGGIGGGGRRPLIGLYLGRPRRREGLHPVMAEGGGGGDGGGGGWAGGGGEGVGGGSVCRLSDGFWWREGEGSKEWMND